RPEPEPEVGASRAEGVVRRLAEGHLGRRAAPALIRERGAVHPDHLVDAGDVASLLRHGEHGRALVGDDALSVDEELVALRLAAEDRMVVEDEHTAALPLLEEHGRGEPADAAAHD